MTRSPVVLASLAFALVAAAPAARTYRIDPAGRDVSAKVAFFGLASKTARFPKLDGSIALTGADRQAIDLDVTLDARALTAPDPTTLKRLKSEKFFWVERYPTVRFSGKRMTLASPTAGTVAGEITARGVTRPASLAVTFATPPNPASARPIVLTGTTRIDRKAFGMTAYSGIVGRKVTIRIKARLVPT